MFGKSKLLITDPISDNHTSQGDTLTTMALLAAPKSYMQWRLCCVCVPTLEPVKDRDSKCIYTLNLSPPEQ